MFSDKSELTITHQTTDDLRQQLRSRLEKLIIIPDEDVTEGNLIDVDDVLGQVDTLPEVPPEEDELLDVGGFDD